MIIQTGTQPQIWAAKHYHPESDSYTAEFIPVSERYLYVSLPWRRTLYCINQDKPLKQWMRFGLWWFKHPSHNCWFGRWGIIN